MKEFEMTSLGWNPFVKAIEVNDVGRLVCLLARCLWSKFAFSESVC